MGIIAYLHTTKPDRHDDEKDAAVQNSRPEPAFDSHIPRFIPPWSTELANRDGPFSHIVGEKRLLCVFLRKSDVGCGTWRV
jgi:hypothetical protein